MTRASLWVTARGVSTGLSGPHIGTRTGWPMPGDAAAQARYESGIRDQTPSPWDIERDLFDSPALPARPASDHA